MLDLQVHVNFFGLLIARLAQRDINESQKCCSVSVFSQYSACHANVCNENIDMHCQCAKVNSKPLF